MKRLGSTLIALAAAATILDFLIEKDLWPSTWVSFFKDWLPWVAIIMNLSALIALLYLWIKLQALKEEAIGHRVKIEKLSADLTLIQSVRDGLSRKA